MKNEDIRTFDVKIRAETGLSNENSNNQTENKQNMAISGVAAVFGQPSIKGDFTEFISPNALNNVNLSQVLLLYSHDFSNILAREDSGTLQTSVQQDGLHFNATLPDTQLGRDTFTNIQNGNIKGMSFGFTIADGGDSWSVDTAGNTIHTINQIDQVFELSLTPIPAYVETSVQVQRDLAQFLINKKEVETMAEKPEEKVETENRDEQMRSLEKFKKQLADLESQISTQVVIDQPAEEKRDSEPVTPAQAPATPADDSTTTQPTSGDLVSMIATLQQAIQSLSQQLAAQQAPSQDDEDDSDDDSNVVLDEKKPVEKVAEQNVEKENKRDGAKAPIIHDRCLNG